MTRPAGAEGKSDVSPCARHKAVDDSFISKCSGEAECRNDPHGSGVVNQCADHRPRPAAQGEDYRNEVGSHGYCKIDANDAHHLPGQFDQMRNFCNALARRYDVGGANGATWRPSAQVRH